MEYYNITTITTLHHVKQNVKLNITRLQLLQDYIHNKYYNIIIYNTCRWVYTITRLQDYKAQCNKKDYFATLQYYKYYKKSLHTLELKYLIVTRLQDYKITA